VAGVPGACAGWLAMVTPAFLVIPLIYFVGARADRPPTPQERHSRLDGSEFRLAGGGHASARERGANRRLIGNDRGGQVRFIFSFTKIDSVWVILHQR
jgi:chromate transporter